MLAKKKEGAVLENSNVLVAVILAIIIASSIVIFSGLDTPERAKLANFVQQISNVQSALVDQLTGVATNYATKGESRNVEQHYYTLATGLDARKYGTMMGADYSTIGTSGKKFQRISPAHAERKIAEGGLGYVLPNIRETNEAWYVTADGKVFNATGFVTNGKTCFTADCYVERELPAKSGPQEDLAAKIADTLSRGENIVEY